jgi:site-specific recombinase XerD
MGILIKGMSGSAAPEDVITTVVTGVVDAGIAATEMVRETAEKLRAAQAVRRLIADIRKQYGKWYADKASALLEADRSASTVRQYIRHVARFRDWMTEHRQAAPCPTVVRKYLKWLADSGRPGTRSIALCAIRAVYESSDEERNAVSGGIRHPEKPAPRGPLPSQHVASLAATAVTLREKLVLLLTNQFGFGVSSLVALTTGCLRLCDGRLWVIGAEGQAGREGVKLNEDVARELSRMLGSARDDDWLFPSPVRPERHLSVRAMYYLFARLRQRAGLRSHTCTVTTLRKATCASVIALDACAKPALAGCLQLVAVTTIWPSADGSTDTAREKRTGVTAALPA